MEIYKINVPIKRCHKWIPRRLKIEKDKANNRKIDKVKNRKKRQD